MVRGQKEICGKHLYSHFYTEGHSGIKDFSVQVIDVTDVNNPTCRLGAEPPKYVVFALSYVYLCLIVVVRKGVPKLRNNSNLRSANN